MIEPYQLFEALGDRTRIAMIDRLATQGAMPTLNLVEGFSMTRQAATKHLLVLERAGLVRSRTEGREVVRELCPDQLAAAHRWLDQRAETWSQKLDAFAAYVESQTKLQEPIE